MTGSETSDQTTLRGRTDQGGSFPEIELHVVEGPDAGQRCLLSAGRASALLVGQSPTCDLRLRDRSVSRRHASFDASSWPVRVTDLGSTNGTTVNGVAILEARLFGGEILQLGDTKIVAERKTGAQRPPPIGDKTRFGRVRGESPAMRRLYPLCERLAAQVVPVLIEGESGTGKELLAESIHESGPNAAGPFVVLDCALRGPDLWRRQREQGDAFAGLLREAAGGTLLLDEIGELDATLQRALVKALAGRTDPRIVVTTRRNLDWLVQHGRFREDLYAAISAARIELPPLRARQGDVPLLARHFWSGDGGSPDAFPTDAIGRAEANAWPGNVRELREFVSGLLAQGGTEASDATAPDGIGAIAEEILVADVSYSEARRKLLTEFEHRYVARMLQAHNGNVTRAAAASGLARRNFQLIRARRKDAE